MVLAYHSPFPDCPILNSARSGNQELPILDPRLSTCSSGGIRAIRGDYCLLAAPQNFPQRLVHFQSAIVVYESLLPESIHEQIDSRARGADHLCQNLVTQDGNLGNRWASLIQVRQPQKHARQPLLGRRSQQLRNMILVLLDAGQQIGHQGI